MRPVKYDRASGNDKGMAEFLGGHSTPSSQPFPNPPVQHVKLRPQDSSVSEGNETEISGRRDNLALDESPRIYQREGNTHRGYRLRQGRHKPFQGEVRQLPVSRIGELREG